MATKFSKGQAVKFERNSITKMDSTIVSAIVTNTPKIQTSQTYVIEFTDGWIPNAIRITQYSLDVNKKYLFVSENELTAI
jgi:hypothetical protein